MKKLFFLTVALCATMLASAAEITLRSSECQVSGDDVIGSKDGVSLVITKPESAVTKPAINAAKGDVRAYAGNTLTFTSTETMTSISFTISAQGKKRLTTIDASTGSVEVKGTPDFTAVWSGSATEVTLTVGAKATAGTDGESSAGQLCFDAVTINTEDGGETPPVVTPDPEINVDSTSVDFGEVTLGDEILPSIVVVTAANVTEKISCYVQDEITPFAVAPGELDAEGGELTVSFAPSTAGTFTDVLTIIANGVSVNVTLKGVAKEAAVVPEKPEPGFKVEKLWEVGVSELPAVGEARQGTGFDGVVYVQDKGTQTIWAYEKKGEAVQKTAYATNTGITGTGLCVDDAGNFIGQIGFSGSTHNSAIIIKKGETTPKTINFTLPCGGRTDFISASGNIFSAEGGCIYYYSNGQTSINVINVKNGAASEGDVTVTTMGDGKLTTGISASVVYKGTANTMIGQARSAAWQKLDADGKVSAFVLEGVKNSRVGACAFTLGGKEFWVYNTGTENYNSEFNIANVTDETLYTQESLYIIDKAGAGSTACANWLTASKIDEYSYYIHQYCPNKGAGLWKVTYVPEEGPGTAVENVQVSNIFAHQGTIYNVENARIFDLSGRDVTRLNGNLNGIYIVKSAEQVVKVIVR